MADLTTLGAKTLSHFLLLNEYEFVALFCQADPNKFDENLFEFWSSLTSSDPANQIQLNILSWACSCFLRHFFNYSNPPEYPLNASNSLDILSSYENFIKECNSNFPNIVQLKKHFFIEINQILRTIPQNKIKKFTEFLSRNNFANVFYIGQIFSFLPILEPQTISTPSLSLSHDNSQDSKSEVDTDISSSFISTNSESQHISVKESGLSSRTPIFLFEKGEPFIDYSTFLSLRCPDVSSIIDFFEGLMINPDSPQLQFANDAAGDTLLIPDDLYLSLCHIVRKRRIHFLEVNPNLTRMLFPDYSVIEFLYQWQMLPVELIVKKLDSLPKVPLIKKFIAQLKLCRAIKSFFIWNEITSCSVPNLLSPSQMTLQFLVEFPRDTTFLQISPQSWRYDFDFIESYVVFSNILSHKHVLIPKRLEKDVFSLLFLQNPDLSYVFNFDQASTLIDSLLHPVSHIITKSNQSYNDQLFSSFSDIDLLYPSDDIGSETCDEEETFLENDSELLPYLQETARRITVVAELYDEPRFEYIFKPLNAIYLDLIVNYPQKIYLLKRIKYMNNLPTFVISALFSSDIISSGKKGIQEILDWIPEPLLQIPDEQRFICVFDYFASNYDYFFVPFIQKDEVYSRFTQKRLPKNKPPESVNSLILDYSALPADFIHQVNKYIDSLPKEYRSRTYLQELSAFVKWTTSVSDLPSGIGASQYLSIDILSIFQKCLKTASTTADICSSAAQIGIDFFEVLFSNFSIFTFPKSIFQEISQMFPIPMFCASNKISASEKLTKNNKILQRYSNASPIIRSSICKPQSTEPSDSSTMTKNQVSEKFLNFHSVMEIDVNDPEKRKLVTALLPIYIEDMLNKSVYTKEEVEQFEDILYYFNLEDSWTSVGEICRKIQSQTGKPLLEEFSVLIPLDRSERYSLFNQANSISPKNLVFSHDLCDSLKQVKNNPVYLIQVLQDENFVIQNVELVLALCNMHLGLYGLNKEIQSMQTCLNMLLRLPNEKRKEKIFSPFQTPNQLLFSIARNYSLQLGINISKINPEIDCSSIVFTVLPNEPQYLNLIQDQKVKEELIFQSIMKLQINSSSTFQKWRKNLNQFQPFLPTILPIKNFYLKAKSKYRNRNYQEEKVLQKFQPLQSSAQNYHLNQSYPIQFANHDIINESQNKKNSSIIQSKKTKAEIIWKLGFWMIENEVECDFTKMNTVLNNAIKRDQFTVIKLMKDLGYEASDSAINELQKKMSSFCFVSPTEINGRKLITKTANFVYIDTESIAKDFNSFEKKGVPHIFISNHSKFIALYKNEPHTKFSPPKPDFCQILKSQNDVSSVFQIAISYKMYSDFCNSLLNSDYAILFSPFLEECIFKEMFLVALTLLQEETALSLIDPNNMIFKTFEEKQKALQLLHSILQFCHKVKKMNIDTTELCPLDFQHLSINSLEQLLLLYSVQEEIGFSRVNLFSKSFDFMSLIVSLIKEHKYKLTIKLTQAKNMNLIPIIFQILTEIGIENTKEVDDFLLGFLPFLDLENFTTVIKAVAPLLSDKKEMDQFQRLLLNGFSTIENEFLLLKWFGRVEEAIALAYFTHNKELVEDMIELDDSRAKQILLQFQSESKEEMRN